MAQKFRVHALALVHCLDERQRVLIVDVVQPRLDLRQERGHQRLGTLPGLVAERREEKDGVRKRADFVDFFKQKLRERGSNR